MTTEEGLAFLAERFDEITLRQHLNMDGKVRWLGQLYSISMEDEHSLLYGDGDTIEEVVADAVRQAKLLGQLEGYDPNS